MSDDAKEHFASLLVNRFKVRLAFVEKAWLVAVELQPCLQFLLKFLKFVGQNNVQGISQILLRFLQGIAFGLNLRQFPNRGIKSAFFCALKNSRQHLHCLQNTSRATSSARRE